MRRKDKQVTNLNEIIEIINNCTICRIAMIDNDKPYIVPLNFGYTLENKKLSLYFHCAKEGRKINILKSKNSVCFEMDCNNNLKEAELACKYGYSYESIIGNGYISFIEDSTEKCFALSTIMKHQTNKDFTFNETQANLVTILKLECDNFTAKRSK